MSFSEVSIYQVKPSHTKEFETLMEKIVEVLNSIQGCDEVKLIKRTHYIKDMETIRTGSAPEEIQKIVKCVRYLLVSSYTDEVAYGIGQQKVYQSYWGEVDRCLVVPQDKFLGKTII